MELPEQIPLALVHDHALLRGTLAQFLGALPGYHLVHAGGDGRGLKRAVALGNTPQMLVLGHAVATDGALLQWCLDHLPQCRLLVLGSTPPADELVWLLCSGVDGFCCEQVEAQDLKALLDRVLAGALCFPPTLRPALRARLAPSRTRNTAALQKLSGRHRQFLVLMARPDAPTYAAIATLMGVSRNTVLKYRRALGQRLGLNTRQQLVQWGRDMGLG